MLFGPVVVALYALVPVIARPTTVSLLTGTNERWSGKMALSRDDMGEMGRLAKLVNKAYCPSEHLEQESPALYLQPRSRSRQESTQQTTNILVTSRDSDIELTQNPGDMSWYIAHTPSTGTLTLAISSINDMEALLDTLDPTVAPLPTLVPLPEYIFPLDQQPIGLLPQIYAAYLAPLETHGAVALMTLLDIIDNPPKPNKGRAPLGSLLSSVARRSRAPPPISRVEIVGHGLGSAVGLLVSLGLHVNQPVNSTVPISVQSKLFSLPRVGDASFANWIDDLVRSDDSLYSMFRITSFGDAVPHLPEQHLGLEHPTSGEIWISSDPHVAYACQGQGSNDEACGMGVSLGKTNVRDGMGPYGGVWVGNQACRPVEHDGL